MESLVIAGVLILIAILIVLSTIKIVPQARAGIIERLGRYQRTLDPGLTIIVPFIDRLRPLIDLREQVVSFEPQPVITSDNLVVSIDSVIYFQVTDAKAATYEIENYLKGVEQLTVTTLRNVVGSLDLEQTLTSRDNINAQLRGVLDEATGKWGIRVNRVELKAIDPPASVQQSMEKQMRADRDKRAAILNAEGNKQAAILDAEGNRTAAILRAEGQAKAQVLRAQGESEAIGKVFKAINTSNATDRVMAYQYLQSLPQLAQGTANKVFVIPAELSGALGAVSRAFAPPARGDAPQDPNPADLDVEFSDEDGVGEEFVAEGEDPLAHVMDAVDKDIEEAVIVEPTVGPTMPPPPSMPEPPNMTGPIIPPAGDTGSTP